MKQSLFTAMLLFAISLLSCSKNENIKQEQKQNKLANTKWSTVDDIAEFIYGKTCTSTIEFIDFSNMQEIQKRETRMLPGTFVYKGTYRTEGDSVFWKRSDDEIEMRGLISGSVIITKMRTMSGGNRTYTKN